jgi:four helix bundle protein
MGTSYRDLIVWQVSVQFVAAVYTATQSFPKQEQYGLVSQLRRAAVSIASNIAEGQGRLTEGEFRHFLGQARGSLLEVETQLYIAKELGFISAGQLALLLKPSGRIGLLLNGLLNSDLSHAPKSRAVVIDD